ncbi:MAG: hypothetical protein CMO44_17780, partial [Verrucomicrobiales bacterium]|nr:hypothetical protein [Verrucomicrobiales bacterium]
GKPDFFPASIPAPMAYYYLAEGGGYDLTDSVSENTSAGSVKHVEEHQLTPGNETHPDPQPGADHSGPNWQEDEYFGTAIACGKIDDTIIQKDTLSFADVDYGSSGSWAMSVWFRHEAGVNFPDYSREQFFGHGDPIMPTTVTDQVHIQFEKSGSIKTILYDKTDISRWQLPCMEQYCGSNAAEWAVNPHCYRYNSTGGFDQGAYDCWRSGRTNAETETDPAIRDYDNGLWHHLVLTTRPDGQKGYNQYLDGVLRSASPYVQGVGKDKGYAEPYNATDNTGWRNYLGVGGGPIDPVGDIRLCGRNRPVSWADQDADPFEAQYDPKRYFRGKVAHFSVWNSALSQAQVNDLYKSYVDKYGLTVTPFKMPANIPTPMAYYFMDEGHGRNLKESVTQASDAGQVLFVDAAELGEDASTSRTSHSHQYNQTNKPNWVYDEHFGRTIQCGEITEYSHQKDFIALADVDYGANGKWAMSVWYRHEVGANFEGYQREQFFGHGDPIFPTSARHQVHIQFEKDDGILGIIKDSGDVDRFTRDCMKQWCPSEEYIQKNPSCYKWFFNTTETNPDAYDCYRSQGAYEGGKKDSASFETLPLAATDNGMWHHLVMTTKGHGKGMNMYIDGKLEATMPRGLNCENEATGCVGLLKYSTIDGVQRPYSDPAYFLNAAGSGGEPIDPVGDIRLCGRQIGGAVTNDLSHTGNEDFAEFDPRRYFHGRVAHFALWDAPLSQHQVSALLEEYRHMYNMPSANEHPSSDADWEAKASLAGWTPPGPAHKKKTCNLDDHHGPQVGAADVQGGFYVEGINGIIRDVVSDSGKRADDGTWKAGNYYPHGEMVTCTGIFCPPLGPDNPAPAYVFAHTCAALRFEYTPESRSTVYELPSQEALDACDFSGAILRGDENAGSPHFDVLIDYDHEKKVYFFASWVGCGQGQKVAVKVAEDYESNFAQCESMGAGSSRIRHCDCNHGMRPSTLIDPCHTAFVYGCLRDMPDDLSCCPDNTTTYDTVARAYVNAEGGTEGTGTCISKSKLAESLEKVPMLKELQTSDPARLAGFDEGVLAEGTVLADGTVADGTQCRYVSSGVRAAADGSCPCVRYSFYPGYDSMCSFYKSVTMCDVASPPLACQYDPAWLAWTTWEPPGDGAPPSPPPEAMSFVDDLGMKHTWTKAQPTIVANVFDALALMHMGMDPSQIIGTYGERGRQGSNLNGYYHNQSFGTGDDFAYGEHDDHHGNHGDLPHDPAYFPTNPTPQEQAFLDQMLDLSPACSHTNWWCDDFDHTILDANGWPDIVIEGPYHGSAAGWGYYAWQPANETAATTAAFNARGIPIIRLTSSYTTEEAPTKGFIEIVQRFEDLARALGVVEVTAATADDKMALCDEIESFKPVALAAQQRGVRALAAYLPHGPAEPNGNYNGYIGTPEQDPVLMMLEELGMAIMHNDIPAGSLWEWNWPEGLSATNLMSSGGRTSGRVKVPYPVDFWLYDERTTLDFTSDSFAAAWPHPAVVAGQYARWPHNGHHPSYGHATTVLRDVREKLAAAQKLHPMQTSCTPIPEFDDEYRSSGGLAPGEYACYNPVSYHGICEPTPPPPVVVTFTASGNVGDYTAADTSALRNKFAAAGGIDAALVTIDIAPGSVLITATIAVPTGTVSTSVRSSLSTNIGTAAAASAALGVTVESAPTIVIASPSLPQPPPPSPKPPPSSQQSPSPPPPLPSPSPSPSQPPPSPPIWPNVVKPANHGECSGTSSGEAAAIAIGCLLAGTLLGAGAVFLKYRWSPIVKRHRSFEVEAELPVQHSVEGKV